MFRRKVTHLPASAPVNRPLDGRAGAKAFLWSWNEVLCFWGKVVG